MIQSTYMPKTNTIALVKKWLGQPNTIKFESLHGYGFLESMHPHKLIVLTS
jgi:hypothetical protein